MKGCGNREDYIIQYFKSNSCGFKIPRVILYSNSDRQEHIIIEPKEAFDDGVMSGIGTTHLFDGRYPRIEEGQQFFLAENSEILIFAISSVF